MRQNTDWSIPINAYNISLFVLLLIFWRYQLFNTRRHYRVHYLMMNDPNIPPRQATKIDILASVAFVLANLTTWMGVLYIVSTYHWPYLAAVALQVLSCHLSKSFVAAFIDLLYGTVGLTAYAKARAKEERLAGENIDGMPRYPFGWRF